MIPRSSRLPIAAGLALTLMALMVLAVVRAAPTTMPDRPTGAPSRGPDAKTSRPQALRTPAPVALPANVVIPRYAQGVEPFRDCETLVYSASWEGIAAAKARVMVVHNRARPDLWTGQMWIATSPL